MSLKASWYDRNSGRPYPLDDASTLTDNAGQPIPPDILCDLRASFVGRHDERLFIRSLTLTPTLVSLVVVDDSGSPRFNFISRKPVETFRAHIAESVNGRDACFLTFDSGVNNRVLAMTFSTWQQSTVAAQVARPIPVGVQTVGKINTDRPMQGVIQVIGGNDVIIRRKSVTIDGRITSVISMSLGDPAGGVSQVEIQDKYIDPCRRRAESRHCLGHQPLELLGGISPDCCGRGFIELRGCVAAFPLADGHGIVLQCEADARSNCLPPALPDALGRLKSDSDLPCPQTIDNVGGATNQPRPIDSKRWTWLKFPPGGQSS